MMRSRPWTYLILRSSRSHARFALIADLRHAMRKKSPSPIAILRRPSYSSQSATQTLAASSDPRFVLRDGYRNFHMDPQLRLVLTMMRPHSLCSSRSKVKNTHDGNWIFDANPSFASIAKLTSGQRRDRHLGASQQVAK